jgi:GntR family transcriptional regulator/MocR family aminotransferase
VDLHVSLDGHGDRAARIYLTVRAAVLDGRLAAGDRVPASRELARQLGVARGTVSVAYDRLVAEGFLESRAGSGTYVTSVALAPDETRRARPGAVRPLPLWEQEEDPAPPRARRLHDLGIGLPDPDLFPLEVWRRLVADQLRRSRLAEATYGGRGSWRLQAEIARFLGLSRSVVATGEDVVVTVGAQQAVDLVCRVLVAPDTAWWSTRSRTPRAWST